MRRVLSATACTAAFASVIAALAAAAAGGTIGSITLSGQLAGSIKLLTTTPGVDGIPLYGCQAQLGGTAVLLNFPDVKVPLNGHLRTMKAIEADVSVKKTGVAERASGPDNQITFSVEVGTTNYNWGSTSGNAPDERKRRRRILQRRARAEGQLARRRRASKRRSNEARSYRGLLVDVPPVCPMNIASSQSRRNAPG